MEIMFGLCINDIKPPIKLKIFLRLEIISGIVKLLLRSA